MVRDMSFDAVPAEPTAGAMVKPYRATEGNTDRLSVIFFPVSEGAFDLEHPRVLGAKTQYHRSVGTVLSRKGEADADDELWDQLEPARDRYATLIIKYPTDPRGKLITDASGLVILPWDFGDSTYRRLHEIAIQQRPLGRNLGSVDLWVKCSNTRKQFVELSVAGAAGWRIAPDKQEKLLARALPLYQSVRIGRDLPDAELRALLGLPPRNADMFDEETDNLGLELLDQI